MAESSYGEKAVGLSFNPSENPDVREVKQLYADIIDFLNTKKERADDGETKRLCSIAITDAQTAQMWAVKAITWENK